MLDIKIKWKEESDYEMHAEFIGHLFVLENILNLEGSASEWRLTVYWLKDQMLQEQTTYDDGEYIHYPDNELETYVAEGTKWFLFDEANRFINSRLEKCIKENKN